MGLNILEFPCTGSFSQVVTLQGQLSAHNFNQVLWEQTWKSNSTGESRLRKKDLLRLSFPESQGVFPTRCRLCSNPRPRLQNCSKSKHIHTTALCSRALSSPSSHPTAKLSISAIGCANHGTPKTSTQALGKSRLQTIPASKRQQALPGRNSQHD